MQCAEQFLTSEHEPDKDFINKMVTKHNQFLVERMDSDSGILDKLFSMMILTREEMQDIKLACKTMQEKNRKLLHCITTKNKVQELVKVLENANQEHLAKYLKADGEHISKTSDPSDVWPLTEKELNLLTSNHVTLIDCLESDDLIARLYSGHVLNKRQRDSVASKPTPSEKNETLLDIMSRYSLRNYHETIRCLYASNQPHIAEILWEGGAVVHIRAQLQGDPAVIADAVEELDTRLKDLLRNKSVQNLVHMSEADDIKFFAVDKGLMLSFRCIGANAISRLLDQLNTGALERAIDISFRYMLSGKYEFTLKLSWSEETFLRVDPTAYTSASEFQMKDSSSDDDDSYYTCSDDSPRLESLTVPSDDYESSISGHVHLQSSSSNRSDTGTISVFAIGTQGQNRCLQIEKGSSVNKLTTELIALFGLGKASENFYIVHEGRPLQFGSTLSLEQAGIRDLSTLTIVARVYGGSTICRLSTFDDLHTSLWRDITICVSTVHP